MISISMTSPGSRILFVASTSLLAGCSTQRAEKKWFAGEPRNQQWALEVPLPATEVRKVPPGNVMRWVGGDVATTVQPTSTRINRPAGYPGLNLQRALAIIKMHCRPDYVDGFAEADLTDVKLGESRLIVDAFVIVGGAATPTAGIVYRKKPTETEVVFDLWQYRRCEPFPVGVAHSGEAYHPAVIEPALTKERETKEYDPLLRAPRPLVGGAVVFAIVSQSTRAPKPEHLVYPSGREKRNAKK